ncbi:hypothetical protein [Aquimarina longa]|uniref:hypothetical protein n=1 Tax=Aquimarina longa TaxID=1080221 RepID=UPI0007822387|nr:hypothetical protein [Aquimarina longa]
MNKKEGKLLSLYYQIEKTDVKQQRLEDRLISISNDLKRNKNIRNFYFVFIIILMLLLAIGSYYVFLTQQEGSNEIILPEEEPSNVNQLLLTNDSLRKEVMELRTNISEYKSKKTLDYINSIDDGKNSNKMSTIIHRSKTGRADVISPRKSKYKKVYCYVNKVYKNNGVIFIETDNIEYYQGKKAVKKAKEYGKAEYDIDKNGDTLYFLYNNYYIHNQHARYRNLELDDNIKIKVNGINQISNGFPLTAFKKVITDKPILVLEISNGVVYKITEQKLP